MTTYAWFYTLDVTRNSTVIVLP